MAALLVPSAAHAFEIESPLSEACHEELTLDGARAAGFPDFANAPRPTEEHSRAMADLVFDLPEDNVWMLALMIGVRSNDIEDRQPTDVANLIHVHDDPAKQDEHCIRRPSDDDEAGDVSALAACRAFIVGELERGGLLNEQLDLSATERVSSYFKFRGKFTISLPTFAYRLGRALHAVEDGFAHTMRDPESGDVRHVLNYIEAFGSRDYNSDRDGYQHLSSLDDCRRTDDVQLARIDNSREAVTSIIAAIADPAPGRRARVEAEIDAALRLIPNCTPENEYCNAPELEEPTGIRTFGCQVAGGGSLAVALAALLLARRRRAAVAVAFAFAFIIISPTIASAQDPADPMPAPEPVEAPTPEPAPQPTPEPAPAPLIPDPEQEQPPEHEAPDKDISARAQDRSDFARWHFDLRAGGAWDDGAASGALGVGVDYKKWSFALLGEWNPWFSLEEIGSSRVGVANGFLAVSYRWYHSDKIALSTRIEAGASVMLFELLGVDKYTTGIYLGGALTSVRFPLSKGAALTFDPIHFALPTPRPFGLPFYYKQYRVTVGIEIALN